MMGVHRGGFAGANLSGARLKVVGQELVYELGNSFAVGMRGDEVGPALQGGQGVCHCNAATANAQKSVIIFGVADPDGLTSGQAHAPKSFTCSTWIEALMEQIYFSTLTYGDGSW